MQQGTLSKDNSEAGGNLDRIVRSVRTTTVSETTETLYFRQPAMIIRERATSTIGRPASVSSLLSLTSHTTPYSDRSNLAISSIKKQPDVNKEYEELEKDLEKMHLATEELIKQTADIVPSNGKETPILTVTSDDVATDKDDKIKSESPKAKQPQAQPLPQTTTSSSQRNVTFRNPAKGIGNQTSSMHLLDNLRHK